MVFLEFTQIFSRNIKFSQEIVFSENPYLLPEGCGACWAASHVPGARRVSGGLHGEVQVIDPCCYVYRGGQASEVPGNGHDQAVERAARGLLAKLTRGKAEEVTVQGNATHVLVTTAEARVRCAADHVAVDPGDLAVTGHHWPSTWAEDAPTAGEDGEVIRVLEVSAPGEVPEVQRSGQI